MRNCFASSLALLAATLVGSLASGEDYFASTDSSVVPVSMVAGGDAHGYDAKGCDDCGKGIDCCCDPGCGGNLYGLLEWTIFAYHRADGSRIGDAAPGEDAQADFHSSLRYTLGYVTSSGLGIRARYWRFGHSSPSVGAVIPAEGLYAKTYNFDVELFETIDLACNWTLELSGGVRWNEFEEAMIDQDGALTEFRLNASDSFGGVGGIELKRNLSLGKFYFGARTAILMANDSVRVQANRNAAGVVTVTQNDDLQDVPLQQFEIFGGWEYEECVGNAVMFLRVGGEWQHWMNFSSAFDGVGGEDVWTGQSNVGFGGFVVGAGLIY